MAWSTTERMLGMYLDVPIEYPSYDRKIYAPQSTDGIRTSFDESLYIYPARHLNLDITFYLDYNIAIIHPV